MVNLKIFTSACLDGNIKEDVILFLKSNVYLQEIRKTALLVFDDER